ncbi:hypothetical protein [Allobaculum sp. JKK-2023]|uniref:hypothetical protein n=1 Tax=Allobaculum sp. JKK-2023 TaxID=3108943 RepID=UPI002B052DAC|nr:hypothetical protein [Allobaculum sp. JKK-2023]
MKKLKKRTIALSMAMCSGFAMAGCNSSESKLSFTSASNDLYTYYYGQNLNGLFTGDDAGFLYSVADDFDGPMPVVEIELDENLYNHTQTVPVSVTSGSDSIARTIKLIILDQYPPEITVNLPEKPDKDDQITDIIKVQDQVDWTGAVYEIPFITQFNPSTVNYDQPGWYAYTTINHNQVIFPFSELSGRDSTIEVLAWDGHGNFSRKTIEIPQ